MLKFSLKWILLSYFEPWLSHNLSNVFSHFLLCIFGFISRVKMIHNKILILCLHFCLRFLFIFRLYWIINICVDRTIADSSWKSRVRKRYLFIQLFLYPWSNNINISWLFSLFAFFRLWVLISNNLALEIKLHLNCLLFLCLSLALLYNIRWYKSHNLEFFFWVFAWTLYIIF